MEETAKQMEKIEKIDPALTLKTAVGCVNWFEKIANEITKDQLAIAMSNNRVACVKGALGIPALILKYKKFEALHGAVPEVREFITTAVVEQKQITKE